MYKITQAWFLYAVSPIHMGAGNSVGELIDSPIQREAHTDYPLLPASGLKGALRHRATAIAEDNDSDKEIISALFGASPTGDELHAGALALTDAVLVAFPIRTLTGTFCYATSTVALARAARLLQGAEQQLPPIPNVTSNPLATEDGERILETLRYECELSPEVKDIAQWIAERAFPQNPAFDYFRNKFKEDLVVLPDEDFSHFVRHSTSIEPHVRIDNATGTAAAGGLFHVENAPPECLFLSTALFGDERSGRNDTTAAELANHFSDQLQDQQVQVGGDATYGRGQIMFHQVGD